MQFLFHMFGFCTCANIKRVPGYKETDLDVQFTDNYLDNWVSISALISISQYMYFICRTNDQTQSQTTNRSSPNYLIHPGISVLLLAVLYTIWTLYSPNNIVSKEPRLYLLSLGIIFSNICVSFYLIYVPILIIVVNVTQFRKTTVVAHNNFEQTHY